MARRQREWANRARAALLQLMGGCCWACGATSCLEFDHWDPAQKPHHTRRTEFSHRISKYRAEWAAGLLQILCEDCNKRYEHRHEPHLYPPPFGVEVPKALALALAGRESSPPWEAPLAMPSDPDVPF